ncbi:MAG: hypothetical protein HZB61_08605 [Nitrospirae bacterium]|nr:hypothetical protein [Nitrospirota bacterium]
MSTLLYLIKEITQTDVNLSKLFCNAREYADIYLLAQKRQKGCDGMGEMETVKEEFRCALYELTSYCRENKYLTDSDTADYDIDSMAREIQNLRK